MSARGYYCYWTTRCHDDVIKWKHFPRYWPFVRGIHRGPGQRPVTRSFDVLFDLRPNKRLGKQSWGWWSETPSSSLWRHRNGNMIFRTIWISMPGKGLLVYGGCFDCAQQTPFSVYLMALLIICLVFTESICVQRKISYYFMIWRITPKRTQVMV